MTLDSYLRDLMGDKSTAAVQIVNDNANNRDHHNRRARLANSTLTTSSNNPHKSSSWVGGETSSSLSRTPQEKMSRWDGMGRSNSDSTLGKPMRRSSKEDTSIIMDARNAAGLVVEVDQQQQQKQQRRRERDGFSSRRRSVGVPVVRAFSDRLNGQRRHNRSERRDMETASKTLDLIRSAGRFRLSNDGRADNIRSQMILNSMTPRPPSPPERRGSLDLDINNVNSFSMLPSRRLSRSHTTANAINTKTSSFPPSNNMDLVGSTSSSIKLVQGKVQHGSKKRLESTKTFPPSLRQLPYPTQTSEI